MKFIPPITFPVRVLGKRQMVSVEEQIGNSNQFVLFLRFTDGFSDIFLLDEDGGIYGTKDNSRPYEQSLRMDIGILIGLDSTRFYHILEVHIEGVITNVWIIERVSESNEIVYAIYFSNCYRFELRREGKKWIATTNSKLFPNINKALAKRIGRFLSNLLQLCLAFPSFFLQK